MSKIINLFGGPGIGKSSIAAGLTHALKRKHITVDAPYEFPKILAWDNNTQAIKDQLYVLANQHRGIVKSYGKVKYIVLDSPIFLSLIYKGQYGNDDSYPQRLYDKLFDDFILNLFNKYDNINIVLNRSLEGEHNNVERYQDLTESIKIDNKIIEELNANNISFYSVDMDDNTVDNIMKILKKIQNEINKS